MPVNTLASMTNILDPINRQSIDSKRSPDRQKSMLIHNRSSEGLSSLRQASNKMILSPESKNRISVLNSTMSTDPNRFRVRDKLKRKELFATLNIGDHTLTSFN